MASNGEAAEEAAEAQLRAKKLEERSAETLQAFRLQPRFQSNAMLHGCVPLLAARRALESKEANEY